MARGSTIINGQSYQYISLRRSSPSGALESLGLSFYFDEEARLREGVWDEPATT
jgi:hypothetical protein